MMITKEFNNLLEKKVKELASRINKEDAKFLQEFCERYIDMYCEFGEIEEICERALKNNNIVEREELLVLLNQCLSYAREAMGI